MVIILFFIIILVNILQTNFNHEKSQNGMQRKLELKLRPHYIANFVMYLYLV